MDQPENNFIPLSNFNNKGKTQDSSMADKRNPHYELGAKVEKPSLTQILEDLLLSLECYEGNLEHIRESLGKIKEYDDISLEAMKQKVNDPLEGPSTIEGDLTHLIGRFRRANEDLIFYVSHLKKIV